METTKKSGFILLTVFGLSVMTVTLYKYRQDLSVHVLSLNIIPHRLKNLSWSYGALLPNNSKDTNIAKRQIKKILFWTTFFSQRYYEFGLGRSPFIEHNCTITECETTNNRSEFNTSHAVIVHIRNMRTPSGMPKFRFPWQYFVFFLMESPMYTGGMEAFNGLFNLTQTYRYDSDIHAQYGTIVKKGPKEIHHVPFDYSKGKSKLIAWFVSHCSTQSHRKHYVAKLQKYIHVDIYGACGPSKCWNRPACYSMLSKTYKFYLSFENSLCRDYATEKLWKILKLNIVPIVLGLVDYKKYLPDHSFIDIREYKSPSALAAYLRELDANATLYNQYFEWKKYYKAVSFPQYHFLCNLCEFLHTHPDFHKTYEHLDKWWNRTQDCVSPEKFFKGHA